MLFWPVTACIGLVDEFSKCLGYLDYIGKVAKNASVFVEGTTDEQSGVRTMEEHSMVGAKERLSVEENMGRVGFSAGGNSIEKFKWSSLLILWRK